ncbi:unnamed protein product [Mytilus edulis]|uniref:TIR domain-containing protein n=1 Tax=Mytilus edulis TaxID=6550 RepID=A0A8S3TH26_MYTED|nr:unnamed protein product [Mytilus edulis]
MSELCIVLLMVVLCYNGSFSKTLDEQLGVLFNRSDLRCPKECETQDFLNKKRFEDSMECCTCVAESLWVVEGKQNGTKVGHFDVLFVKHYIELKVKDHAVNFYNLIYTYGNITDIPSSVCNFSTIVYIDLSFNQIKDIRNIACLSILDTLLLAGNKIQSLIADVFHGMKHLRRVDVSFNQITKLEPTFFLYMEGSMFHFDLSYNNMSEIDVTNMVRLRQKYFCVVNFSHNVLNEITNPSNFSFQREQDFGHGGYLDFTYNNFSHFFNFEKIGFQDLQLFGKMQFYSFDFQHNNWICDCKFYPFVSQATLSSHILHASHVNFKCNRPPQFKNTIIKNFRHYPDLLICNISMSERCPHKCHCFYQPSRNQTVVNCRAKLSSKRFPLVLPEYENLALDFSKNLISDLDNQFERTKNYAFRIKEINLEGNNFHSISEFAVSQLKRTTMFNMKQNQITSIDRSLRNLRPCNVQLGRLDLVCTCNDLWFQSWLPSPTMPCYNNTLIFCKTETGYKSITKVTKSELGCTEDSHLKWFNLCIGILISLVVIFAFTGYNFYIEIYILWRRFLRKVSRPVSRNSFQYDIYISCNEDDDGLRNWISCELLSHLNDRGLKSFLPYRDCQPGRPREEEIIDSISKSKSILVLLSDLHHLERESTKAWISCEWKYTWLKYREDFSKNVIIINYDFLNNRDVSNRYIQAFMRASICIDFSNYRKDMWSTLNSVLGLSSPSYGFRYHRFQSSLDTATIYLQT